MIRIRLARVGKKGRPSYRIVVADIAAPRDGSYLEWIGNYDPMADPPAVSLKEDRAAHWLSMGAIPSDAVSRLLDRNGLMQRTPTNRTKTKKSGEDAGAGGASVAVAAPPQAAAAPPQAAAQETPIDDSPAEEPAAEEEPSGDEEAVE